MVALPGLESYSDEQLFFARGSSQAFARYEKLLDTLDGNSLHAIRHRAWLECVLATFHRTASTRDVCTYWTRIADLILRRVWSECGLGQSDAVMFALGKHGAEELNLSSDIDLLIVSEGPGSHLVERGLRRLQAVISQVGADGFCFRLDFDLRPGGKLGPLITTPAQFQDYYWSQGETWERLALVRLRAVAGNSNLAPQIEDLARRFSYRKFLDYTLLEDLKALRSAVHQQGFLRREGQLHLKLEVGGIRDIELFVHSLQVLNGGKLPALQTVSTPIALERLGEAKLLSATEVSVLAENYWLLRHAENIVQAFEDLQTHVLMDDSPQIPALPSSADLRARMAHVDGIVSGLLGRVNLNVVLLPVDLEAQKNWLRDLGFGEAAITSSWENLMAATAMSHKNDRDERARQAFLFRFVNEISRQVSLDRDLGLNLLLDFVRATRAKATFFSMLLHSPRLIEDLARLFCLSPYLGSILASRPELLDHFILQVDQDWSKDSETLLQQMSDRKRLTEIWAASGYINDRDLTAMCRRITDTADSICRQLLVHLKNEFPESRLEILTLGKWGGRELGLQSDLDFMFVTPDTPVDHDFKVARRFISRLTDPSKGGGTLYDLDLRLRPSGQSGPLLVPLAQLHTYWQSTAAPWERQAFLRARPLGRELANSLQKNLLYSQSLTAEDLGSLGEIRKKLHRAPTLDEVDIKYAPGGLLDIEFVSQTAVLAVCLPTGAVSTPDMICALADAPSYKLAQRKG